MRIQALNLAQYNSIRKMGYNPSKSIQFSSLQENKEPVLDEVKTVLKNSQSNLIQTQELLFEFEELKKRTKQYSQEGKTIKAKAYAIQDEAESWYEKGKETGFKNFATEKGTIVCFKNINGDNLHPCLTMEEYDGQTQTKTVNVRFGHISKIQEYNASNGKINEYFYHFRAFEKYFENIEYNKDGKTTQRNFIFGLNGKLSLLNLGLEELNNGDVKTKEAFSMADSKISSYCKNKIEIAPNGVYYGSADKEYSVHFDRWDCKIGLNTENRIQHYAKRLYIDCDKLVRADINTSQNRGNKFVEKRYDYKDNVLNYFTSKVKESYPNTEAEYRMSFKNGMFDSYTTNCSGIYDSQAGYVFD